MILLATLTHKQLCTFTHPHLGRLVTPRSTVDVETSARTGLIWAADNDAFNGFDPARFTRMLDRLTGLPGCRFVACPDSVGDAHSTEDLFYRWAPGIARRGLPIGYVLQDNVGRIPWGDLAAVFVGGTDAFKGSPRVAEIVGEAKHRGLWAHMGRVNSIRRMRYAASIGCDSVDGTNYSRWSKTWLPGGLAAISGGRQLSLLTNKKEGQGQCEA